MTREKPSCTVSMLMAFQLLLLLLLLEWPGQITVPTNSKSNMLNNHVECLSKTSLL